jgi:hypothetical protein
MEATTQNIKNLLFKFELSNSKVEYDYNERCLNPMQQGAATRIYNQSCSLAKSIGMDSCDFIQLHKEVIKEFKLSNSI